MRTIFSLLAVLFFSASAFAGHFYEIESTDGKTKTQYRVRFGGGKLFEMRTGFDPKTKQFVYLEWKRGTEAPAHVAVIWDHRTGETIKLYKFPGVDQPLPVIPSLAEMKVCPLTGDKNYKVGKEAIVD